VSEFPKHGDNGKRALGFFVALAMVIALALFVSRTHNKNEEPYTPAQAAAKLVGLQVLTPTDDQGSNISAALNALGGASADTIQTPGRHRSWQYVVGRVDVATPATHNAIYDVLVVDDRLHQVVASTFAYPERSAHISTGQGWDPALASLHSQYDFQPSSANNAAFFTAGTTSLPFFARLAPSTAPVVDLHKDISVVLVLQNGPDKVFWSQRLN
jgi:hypothetical protein